MINPFNDEHPNPFQNDSRDKIYYKCRHLIKGKKQFGFERERDVVGSLYCFCHTSLVARRKGGSEWLQPYVENIKTVVIKPKPLYIMTNGCGKRGKFDN